GAPPLPVSPPPAPASIPASTPAALRLEPPELHAAQASAIHQNRAPNAPKATSKRMSSVLSCSVRFHTCERPAPQDCHRSRRAVFATSLHAVIPPPGATRCTGGTEPARHDSEPRSTT